MENDDDKKFLLLTIASFSMFIACLLIAYSIMPEDCPLFESRQTDLICDGIDLEKPQPCELCLDEASAGAARIFAGFGFCFIFFPFVIATVRWKTTYSEKPIKLFD